MCLFGGRHRRVVVHGTDALIGLGAQAMVAQQDRLALAAASARWTG